MIGTLPVEPPLYGVWSFGGFPDVVELEGAIFNRAEWAWPFYSGVVAQYRQDVATNAMHLLVYRDGSYVVTHLDEFNPDLGFPVEHALVDAPAATCVVLGAVGFAAGLVAGLLVFK
jgi:hypothetical protein